jgi:hypothetical protein
MEWFLAGGELVVGLALFIGLFVVISFLRPPPGQMLERGIVRFPGAPQIVGLGLTLSFGVAVALIAVGIAGLR